MTDLHVDNTIYPMHVVSRAYLRRHRLTRQEFDAADRRYQILRYIAACPSRFDALPEEEMVLEVDRYVSRNFERVDWRDFQ